VGDHLFSSFPTKKMATSALLQSQPLSSLIILDVVHTDVPGSVWAELKFDPDLPISGIKDKLYRHVGTAPCDMQLTALNASGGVHVALDDDSRSLSGYGVTTGMTLRVVDTNPQSIVKATSGATDSAGGDSEQPSFVLSDKAYESRPSTVRSFLKTLRKDRPDLFNKPKDTNNKGGGVVDGTENDNNKERAQEETLEQVSARIKLKQRCKVDPGDIRGEVAYVGPRPTTRGVWVGVTLDEPLGNTDGSDGGGSLFQCRGPRYGLWATPTDVQIGDYPPLDPFDLAEI